MTPRSLAVFLAPLPLVVLSGSVAHAAAAPEEEFISLFKPGAIHKRKPTWAEDKPDGRWRSFEYDELLKRDKMSLDLFWIKDESLEDSASLPDPDVLAQEIVEDLQDALEQFGGIASALTASRE